MSWPRPRPMKSIAPAMNQYERSYSRNVSQKKPSDSDSVPRIGNMR